MKKRSLPVWLSIPIGLALLAGAFLLLRHELEKYSIAEAVRVLGSLSWWRIALSLVITAAGYVALVAHDAIALAMIRRTLPLPKVGLAAFVAFAFANSAPMSFAVGGTLRYRYYARWGISPRATTRVVTIGLTTYALGLLFAAAIALTAGAFPMPRMLHLPFHSSQPLGIIAGVILAGYLGWVAIRKQTGRPGKRRHRPSIVNTVTQIGVSLADWVLSALALYVLIQAGHPVSFATFFGIFILGQLVSLIAQIPGGLGVFDAVVIWGLAPGVTAPTSLAALVAYRLIYYLLPLIAATAILVLSEAKHATAGKAARSGDVGK